MECDYDSDNADTLSIDTLALEQMVQAERSREIDELNQLSKKVRYLHTNLLFYRNPNSKMGDNCFEAWQSIVKRIGGTSRQWRELGYHLGVSQQDLDYIAHSVKEDSTETVLKVFMQDDNSTLNKVTDALVTMKRYDVLKALEKPLVELAQSFYNEDSRSDTGYHSCKDSEERQIAILKNVQNDLPFVLRTKTSILNNKEPDKSDHPKNVKEVVPADVRNKGDKRVLFLTFAEDGRETALNIRRKIDNWPADCLAVTTIMLNDKKEDVLRGPESFIRKVFEGADFVVPVITAGYLKKINCHERRIPSRSEDLDAVYVHFIYTLTVNHYIHATGCLNQKVRSVVPSEVDRSVFSDITLYPDLMPWISELDFDEDFKVMLEQNGASE